MTEPQAGYDEVFGEYTDNPETPKAGGEVISALGRVWTVSHVEQRLKGQFERWLKRRALLETEAICAEVPEEIGMKYRAVYAQERAVGQFKWGSAYAQAAINANDGFAQWLYILLRRCHPDITEEKAAAIIQDNPTGVGDAMLWARLEGNRIAREKEKAAREVADAAAGLSGE